MSISSSALVGDVAVLDGSNAGHRDGGDVAGHSASRVAMASVSRARTRRRAWLLLGSLLT
jgi:hypothetical protein